MSVSSPLRSCAPPPRRLYCSRQRSARCSSCCARAPRRGAPRAHALLRYADEAGELADFVTLADDQEIAREEPSADVLDAPRAKARADDAMEAELFDIGEQTH